MDSNAGSSSFWLYDHCYVNSLKKVRLKLRHSSSEQKFKVEYQAQRPKGKVRFIAFIY